MAAAVVGAGVIGLAIARQLAQQGREVIVLEAATAIGTQTSSRNSEVVHAGLYYKPGSLKARLCVEGRQELYSYCESRGVDAKKIGKLIVATHSDQLPLLRRIATIGQKNGVNDLHFLPSAAEVSALEPEVHGVAGLFSPSTGIVDSHALMLALQRDALDCGATIACNTTVVRGSRSQGRGWVIESRDNSTGAPFEFEVESVVNSAGLSASKVAACLGCSVKSVPTTYFAKGNYFKLSGGSSPFSHLVYPVPESAGLGVHATIDLGGRLRFGPDVEWIDDPCDLAVDQRRADSFYAAIRSYWPGLSDDALTPDYCGIRPKLSGASGDSPPSDFAIHGSSVHGQRGLVCLYGIESPGLTSAMGIARVVAEMVKVEEKT
mmetsp:Transcript_46284/g.93423  ORF Transcript_46284/g.93423 Transcript_46284/m.93423 type:complete len:377 (-) Transcript_46284:89-1219(-)